jgi:hypothetical protein
VSLFGGAGRWLDRKVRAVTRTAKHIPVAGSLIKAGEGALKGPVGRTFNKIVSNPIVSTAFGPIAVPAHMAYAATTGGLHGAEEAAKQEIRNPVRRAAVTALGAVFPPAAPAAVALNAANVALNAAESGKPEDMAKAAVQIGAAYAGADAGDPHMKEVAGVLDKAKQLRAALPGHLPGLHELNAGWLGSTRANLTLEQLHPDAIATLQPHNVQTALGTLQKAVKLPPGGRMDPAALTHATDTVGAAIGLALAHPHIPFLLDLGHAATAQIAKLENVKHPNTSKILRDLKAKIMAHTAKRTAELNALVHGYNAKQPQAVQQVSALRAAHQHGDHAATSMLDDMRRRTAALKKAGEYHVDVKGYTRHASAAHPAAQPHDPNAFRKAVPPKPPLHAPAHH